MKLLEIDYAEGVIEHEATILGENIFWNSGRTYGDEDLRYMATRKLIQCN